MQVLFGIWQIFLAYSFIRKGIKNTLINKPLFENLESQL